MSELDEAWDRALQTGVALMLAADEGLQHALRQHEDAIRAAMLAAARSTAEYVPPKAITGSARAAQERALAAIEAHIQQLGKEGLND